MIPYGRQTINAADINAVAATLRSDWLTQGPCVPAFEAAVANRCEAKYGIAVSNATTALHLACLALDVGPGDYVWTSPNTFVASANCARYCGAMVDFVDIDPSTLNLSKEALRRKLETAKSTGKLPKVVIPVHFSGLPCDMESIAQLGREFGFRVIEDASHAIGAIYKGEPVGNCRYSDITVFSFHPVKIITTGEGGLATTNQPEIAERLRRLRSHGITRESTEMTGESEGPWYYQQIELGYNYRLTDIQAALGISQLTRLDEFIARRQALVDTYDHLLQHLPVISQFQSLTSRSAHHLYVIQLTGKQHLRRVVFEQMRSRGIGVNVHYIPVHLQPYYRDLGFAPGDFPHTENYYAVALSLPLHPSLSDAEQEFVVDNLAHILK